MSRSFNLLTFNVGMAEGKVIGSRPLNKLRAGLAAGPVRTGFDVAERLN